MDDRQRYRDLADRQAGLPIFLRPWWLDATCGPERWNVAIVAAGDELDAALPFLVSARAGFRILSQPKLTQFIGPWLRSTGGKLATDLGRQKDLMEGLIDALPRHDYYGQNWGSDITNWLPFYWRGFRQTTRYTYVLTDLTDLDAVWKGMQQKIRGDIRKASSRFGVEVDPYARLEEFLALNRATFSRQGRQPSYDDAYVRSIDAACAARNCRAIFVARDSAGRPHAGAYIIWDDRSAFYIMGGGDPELRSSGATSLCLWEAIRFAAARTSRFDFEGSMLEQVERFFRGFGAVQVPYFHVSRCLSTILRIREAFASPL